MNKVCIIIPYFGKFPNYFDFWLKSAYYNDKFDFLIFTDNKSYHTQNNVKFIHMSFEAFKKLLQKQVEFPICLNEPYKLCDYRPLYGCALQKYISNYKFWGFGDVDLILGNLSNFISDDILNKYEKIYELGHLTLLRNTIRCNNLWNVKHHLKNAYRYDEAFKTPYPCHFDETNGLTQIAKLKKINTYTHNDFADINRKKYNFSLFNVNPIEQFGIFEWKKGVLKYIFKNNDKINSKEMAYAHFQKRKLSVPCHKKIPVSFLVVPNRFLLRYDVLKELSSQKKVKYYKYYRSNRKEEILKNIRKHAIQQRVYRIFFRKLVRYYLDKK